MSDRDDFSDKVKLILAQRVALRCSHPDCRAPTTGPHTEAAKRVSVGVAAHITAAAEGGPRFDPTLTAEQRASIENGIWMCETHGTLIDRDEVRYPESLLREWKAAAEARAEAEIGKTIASPAPQSKTTEKALEVSHEAWQRTIKAVGTAQNRFGPGREVPVFMMMNERKAQEVIASLPFSEDDKNRLREAAGDSRDQLYSALDTKYGYFAAHKAWAEAKNFLSSNSIFIAPEIAERFKAILDEVFSVLTKVKMEIEGDGSFRRDVSRTLMVDLNKKLDELETLMRERLNRS